MSSINSIQALENIYGPAVEPALWKEIDHINHHYRQFIEASPFLVLATQGENGLDCSPRGDPAGFVRVASEKQLLLPDRRGNNRLDSLRNIVHNPQVSLIFLIPNVGETLRVSGRAEILRDEDLNNSFAINGKASSSVISVQVEKVFYQCQKALARSKLWDSSTWIERGELPSAGDMAQNFAALQGQEIDGAQYDADYPERMHKTIY